MARSKVTVVNNLAGFQAIRTAPKVMKMLDDIADGIASRAGDGFEARKAERTGGKVRGRAAVVTVSARAMRRQARDHTLEKSLGGGQDG